MRILALYGLLVWCPATFGAVTVQASKHGVPLDLSRAAVPIKLAAGDYGLTVRDGVLYGQNAAAERRYCTEALVMADPVVVSLEVDGRAFKPLSVARIGYPVGQRLRVRQATTIYLFLADRETRGNSGSVTVDIAKGPDFDSERPIRKVKLDAVANCYELNLDERAAPVELPKGQYVIKMTASSLAYRNREVPQARQPCHVVIDCNPSLVATSWDDYGDTPVGSVALSYQGDAFGLYVRGTTVVRLYLPHSDSYRYRGEVTISMRLTDHFRGASGRWPWDLVPHLTSGPDRLS